MNEEIRTANGEKINLEQQLNNCQTANSNFAKTYEQQSQYIQQQRLNIHQHKQCIVGLQRAKEIAENNLKEKEDQCKQITEQSNEEKAELRDDIKKLRDETSSLTNVNEQQKEKIDGLEKAKLSTENSLHEHQKKLKQMESEYTNDVAALKSNQEKMKEFIDTTVQTKEKLEVMVWAKDLTISRMKSDNDNQIHILQQEIVNISQEKSKLEAINASQKLELDASEKCWEINEAKYKNTMSVLKANQNELKATICGITEDNDHLKNYIKELKYNIECATTAHEEKVQKLDEKVKMMSEEKIKLINERQEQCNEIERLKEEHEHAVKTITKKYKEKGKRWKCKAILYLENMKKDYELKINKYQENQALFNNAAQQLKLFAEAFGSHVADAYQRCNSSQEKSGEQQDSNNGKERSIFLPPASAVKVIELVLPVYLCVCVSVIQHSPGWIVRRTDKKFYK